MLEYTSFQMHEYTFLLRETRLRVTLHFKCRTDAVGEKPPLVLGGVRTFSRTSQFANFKMNVCWEEAGGGVEEGQGNLVEVWKLE
jgi:hypothetical protein